MDVLLTNTLKPIKSNFPIKPPKKFLLVILRIPKHTFCTLLTLKRLRFPATVPLMRLLFTFFAAHPFQNIRAFVTEKPAPKQVLPETQKHFCEKFSVPILPTETLNDFETETTLSPVNVVSSENKDAIESIVSSRSRSGRGIKPSAYLDDSVLLTNHSDVNIKYREAVKSSLKANGSKLLGRSTMRSLRTRPGCFLRFPQAEKQLEAGWFSN